ncbi:MAG TPA: mercuric reductase [Pirellulaceae bacterium]|nr:mercuric reductase [Pirellulaceae bacterium]
MLHYDPGTPRCLVLAPLDEFNAALLARVHPPDWQNPTPQPLYDLVAIGGGTAGLVAAAGTAGLGGKVALVERGLLGGDCLNFGCVPSKALIRAARAAYDVGRAAEFGIHVASGGRQPPEAAAVDFAAVMSRLRRLRAEISENDSAQRFQQLGVDVFLGDARFTSRQTIEVAGQTLRFKRCVIATGGRAAIPAVPGLEEAGCLTNETVFSLTELPRRLIVIGGGPIGCELAQAFRRFGSEVTLVQRGQRLLPKDEPEAAEILARQFEREGIKLLFGATSVRAETAGGIKRLLVNSGGRQQGLDADAVLVAAGRTPNIEGLNLAAAGVEHNNRGVIVDDFLQTANPRIMAAGDVAGGYQFTHAADAMARACVQNAFFSLAGFGRKRLSGLVVPWTTYTDPEIAHVGLTPASAADQHLEIDSYREELRHVDRAILDGDDEGFAVIHCRRGTPQVVGCTIVARHAGEMIGEVSLLMTARIPLSKLAGTIHCYPTQAEILKRLGDQYNKRRLTPRVADVLKAIIGWRS